MAPAAVSGRAVGRRAAASGAEPAVPAVPANAPVRGAMMAQPQLSDAALGFKPSTAPPLDRFGQSIASPRPSSPITARPLPMLGMASTIDGRRSRGPARSAARVPTCRRVVANMDAVSGAPAAIAAMNGGMAPTAVIYFPGDGTNLVAAARAEVRAAVAAFKASGGAGTIRVVGHASSRTANMPVEKHLEMIFDKSQARANAVAQELIHEGVPADRCWSRRWATASRSITNPCPRAKTATAAPRFSFRAESAAQKRRNLTQK